MPSDAARCIAVRPETTTHICKLKERLRKREGEGEGEGEREKERKKERKKEGDRQTVVVVLIRVNTIVNEALHILQSPVKRGLAH